MNFLEYQYNLVLSSREVVFNYFRSFPLDIYNKEVYDFNKRNIKDLQVHIANVYIFWVGNFILKKNLSFFEPDKVDTVQQVEVCFKEVNGLAHEFIHHFKHSLTTSFTNFVAGRDIQITTTPLEVFTHAITHEFHHKGQLFTMGRLLGFPPPDADIIRF